MDGASQDERLEQTSVDATSTNERAALLQNEDFSHSIVNNVHNPLEMELESTMEKQDANKTPSSSRNGQEITAQHDQKQNDHAFVEIAKANVGDPSAEFEYDSSPESSGDSSSDSDSSSDGEDSEATLKGEDDEGSNLLGAREQARLLMEGGDEGEDEKSADAAAAAMRTANELPPPVYPKPDIEVTPEMEVVEFGAVKYVFPGMILIESKDSGEKQILGDGSVTCLEDRRVIGCIAEQLSRVMSPCYLVYFADNAEIKDLGIEAGTKIFYVYDHTNFILTERLKSVKGSDASNMHDEEAGADEVEFSDDEAEAAYKRQMKAEMRAAREGRSGQMGDSARGYENGRGRGAQGGRHQGRARGRDRGRGRVNGHIRDRAYDEPMNQTVPGRQQPWPRSRPNTATQQSSPPNDWDSQMQNDHTNHDTSQVKYKDTANIRYEDDSDEDMYTPLARSKMPSGPPPPRPSLRQTSGSHTHERPRSSHFNGQQSWNSGREVNESANSMQMDYQQQFYPSAPAMQPPMNSFHQAPIPSANWLPGLQAHQNFVPSNQPHQQQYGNQQQQQQYSPNSIPPNGQIPAGSYVNPNFLGGLSGGYQPQHNQQHWPQR